MEYLSIPHYRGLKEKYDEQKHSDGIFFTTDTHEIIANNATYGETIDTWSIADGILTLTMTSGKTLEITFDEATESAKGFLSAEDKKKINSLEGNFDKKVDKVPGKSLVDDTEIDKLSNLPNKTDLDSAIADAKKAGTDAQTSLTAHINNKENPHEVTKAQVGLENVTNDAQVKRSEMGVANGVATLDENGLVPSSQLPSFVDDVLEFDLKDNFPTTGVPGKIYIAKDSNRTYRWDENQYKELSVSLTLGETSTTAYAGDKGKDISDKLAKVRNTQLSHIKDIDTFSVTAEKVSLNYDCYVGDQYGAEATSHSVDIPVASETQAGIVTAEDKKAITNLDTTYAKKAYVDKSIKDLSGSIAAGGVISLTENPSIAYAKSYVLSQGNKEIGTINIPKDMIVSSGSLQSVTSVDNPYVGAKVGDKYVDLVIANSTSEHIYIPVSDLIDTYLAGDGLTLKDSKFSIKKDTTSESYLTVSSDGVKVSGIDSALEGKVDKEEGKQLSTNDYTTAEKNKLAEAIDESTANTLINTAISKLTKASVGLGDVDNTADASKPVSTAQKKAIDDAKGEVQGNLDTHTSRTDNPHSVTKEQIDLGNVTNDAQVKRSEMGTANGVATLDGQGHVPASQLPSYVDDVVDVYATYTEGATGVLTNIEVFLDSGKTQPVTGESGKIYIDVENNYQFRWTGTKYAPVGAPTVIGEVAGTAYDGGKGKAISDKINEHVTKTDNPHSVTKAQVGLGNVDNTSDKLKPISDATKSALEGKVDKVAGKSLTSNDFTDVLKAKLDSVAENANNYSLPTASETELGGVMVDSTLNSTSTNPVQNRVIWSAIDEINSKLSWTKID